MVYRLSFVFVLLVVLQCSVSFALKPSHIYLTYTGNPQTMRVSFMTSAPLPITPTPYVFWWEQPSKTQHVLNITLSGSTKPFVRPNNLGTQYITSIVMGYGTHMIPGNSYTYQIRLNNNDATTWSDVYDFKGMPALNSPANVAIYGDLGSLGPILTSTNPYGLLAYAKAHDMDLIMHNGDLAYNLGAQNGSVGESFFNNLQNISARIPYVVSPGNHEYWGSDNSFLYYTGWWSGQTALGQLSGSTNPLLYYSYDVSYAHFVVINTEVYCEDIKNVVAMYNWLKNDLATYRAKNANGWIFAIGHRQMYLGTTGAFDSYLQRYGFNCTKPSDFSTCNTKRPCYVSNSAQCGWAIEPLFFQYKVDFSFEGHQHLYQRFYPIGPNYKYETQTVGTYVNPQYPIHVISGAAGMQSQGFRSVAEPRASSPHVAFSSTSASVNSFTMAHIFNLTHIHFEQVSCDTATPGVQDSWWVVKDLSKPRAVTASFTVTSTGATGCQ